MPRFKPPLTLRSTASAEGPEAGRDAQASTIGDLARDFGLTLRALRFYESKGMLQPRRRGLTRLYFPADRARLATILKGKQLGLSLREIRETLARDAPGGEVSGSELSGSEVSGSANSGGPTLRLNEAEVAQKIAALEAQKQEIELALAGLRDHRGRPSSGREHTGA